MLAHYKFTLINKDPRLNQNEIVKDLQDAVQYIEDGKKRKKKKVFKNVVNISLKKDKIKENSFVIHIDLRSQDNQAWKQKIGWYLKNKKGKVEFCNPKNPKEMFEIEKLQTFGQK
jgi:hypothetical protein